MHEGDDGDDGHDDGDRIDALSCSRHAFKSICLLVGIFGATTPRCENHTLSNANIVGPLAVLGKRSTDPKVLYNDFWSSPLARMQTFPMSSTHAPQTKNASRSVVDNARNVRASTNTHVPVSMRACVRASVRACEIQFRVARERESMRTKNPRPRWPPPDGRTNGLAGGRFKAPLMHRKSSSVHTLKSRESPSHSGQAHRTHITGTRAGTHQPVAVDPRPFTMGGDGDGRRWVGDGGGLVVVMTDAF